MRRYESLVYNVCIIIVCILFYGCASSADLYNEYQPNSEDLLFPHYENSENSPIVQYNLIDAPEIIAQTAIWKNQNAHEFIVHIEGKPDLIVYSDDKRPDLLQQYAQKVYIYILPYETLSNGWYIYTTDNIITDMTIAEFNGYYPRATQGMHMVYVSPSYGHNVVSDIQVGDTINTVLKRPRMHAFVVNAIEQPAKGVLLFGDEMTQQYMVWYGMYVEKIVLHEKSFNYAAALSYMYTLLDSPLFFDVHFSIVGTPKHITIYTIRKNIALKPGMAQYERIRSGLQMMMTAPHLDTSSALSAKEHMSLIMSLAYDDARQTIEVYQTVNNYYIMQKGQNTQKIWRVPEDSIRSLLPSV